MLFRSALTSRFGSILFFLRLGCWGLGLQSMWPIPLDPCDPLRMNFGVPSAAATFRWAAKAAPHYDPAEGAGVRIIHLYHPFLSRQRSVPPVERQHPCRFGHNRSCKSFLRSIPQRDYSGTPVHILHPPAERCCCTEAPGSVVYQLLCPCYTSIGRSGVGIQWVINDNRCPSKHFAEAE